MTIINNFIAVYLFYQQNRLGEVVKKNILFLLVVFFPVFVSSKVIVTHGAWGDDQDWYQPGGYFYDALRISGNVIGQDVIAFTWDQFLGGITHKERLNAGRELAKLVVDLTTQGETEIIIIGHSYGGHVAKAASQILAVALGLESADRPIVIVDKSLGQTKTVSEWDQKYYEQVCNEVKSYTEVKVLKSGIKKDFLIDALYTLGTPNDIDDYESHMDVIQFLFNFHSNGDLVSDFVGDRKLPDPKHDRAVNLEVRIKGSGWFGLWGQPNHLQMHAQEIAKWILYVPFYLANEKQSGFQEFTFEHDGRIQFGANRFPKYSYAKKQFRNIISKFKCIKNKITFLKVS